MVDTNKFIFTLLLKHFNWIWNVTSSKLALTCNDCTSHLHSTAKSFFHHGLASLCSASLSPCKEFTKTNEACQCVYCKIDYYQWRTFLFYVFIGEGYSSKEILEARLKLLGAF